MADSDLPPPQTLSPIYNNGLAWCGDGSFVFPVSDSKSYGSLRTNNSLWRIRVNLSNGQAAGKPERFTADSPDTIWNLTCTESGKRLSFVKSYSWADVYVAELGPDGTSIKPPRRLTFDNRGSSANAWTRDSRNILFESERNGTNQIFRQAIGSNSAELVAWGPRELSDGDLIPDRKWVLFRETESKETKAAENRRFAVIEIRDAEPCFGPLHFEDLRLACLLILAASTAAGQEPTCARVGRYTSS